jgi:hypothetical protein
MSTDRRRHHGRDDLIAPREEPGAGPSCHTQPAPVAQTATRPQNGGTDERLSHFIPSSTHDGAARPLRVEYQQSPALGPDECRRRIRLAYAYVLGIVPWPDEHATAAGSATETPSS